MSYLEMVDKKKEVGVSEIYTTGLFYGYTVGDVLKMCDDKKSCSIGPPIGWIRLADVGEIINCTSNVCHKIRSSGIINSVEAYNGKSKFILINIYELIKTNYMSVKVNTRKKGSPEMEKTNNEEIKTKEEMLRDAIRCMKVLEEESKDRKISKKEMMEEAVVWVSIMEKINK